MSRSFVVGKRNNRVVFGPALGGLAVGDGVCPEAVVNQQMRIVIETETKRRTIFIG
jgi:hypothetical protein